MNDAQQVTTCPECGAQPVMGMNCWEQLGGVLAWEWHDPELAAAHFLTVASYNLQHPAQFTEEAITKLREIFIEHIDHQTSVEFLRRQIGRSTAGDKKVLKTAAERVVVLRRWSMTIADVYLPDHSAGAAERVRAWALAIRDEL